MMKLKLPLLLMCAISASAAVGGMRGQARTWFPRRLGEAIAKTKCHACCACKHFLKEDRTSNSWTGEKKGTTDDACMVGKCHEDSRESESISGEQLFCWDQVKKSDSHAGKFCIDNCPTKADGKDMKAARAKAKWGDICHDYDCDGDKCKFGDGEEGTNAARARAYCLLCSCAPARCPNTLAFPHPLLPAPPPQNLRRKTVASTTPTMARAACDLRTANEHNTEF